MKRSSAELKALARTQLSGKYGLYIGAALVYNLISGAASWIITMIFPTFSISNMMLGYDNVSLPVSSMILFYVVEFIISLILSIFTIGFLKMYLDGSRGYQVMFSDLFYGFRHHPDRVILLSLALGLLYAACMLPGYVVIILAILLESFGLLIAGPLLLVAGLVAVVVLTLGFSQAMFLLTDYDDLGPIQAAKESWKMMKGHKGRLFYIDLSFLGLSLLSLLSCGIAMLWITPYMRMTQTFFYRELDGELDAPASTPQEDPDNYYAG
ncbi:MAG TPA: DUF975 family protein [Candidatus Pullilachnospira intestinigallinarum]|nr:DUF975 family protein [Candidatus Pullilachnospira intestinigallinarum]